MAKKKTVADIHTFTWQGINRKGAKVSGELQAESAIEIKSELRKQGVSVTKKRNRCFLLVIKFNLWISPLSLDKLLPC